jgi:hypothetical protein
MWFWPVNEMTKLVVYLFFLILRIRNMSSRIPGSTRTPGWLPLFWNTLLKER